LITNANRKVYKGRLPLFSMVKTIIQIATDEAKKINEFKKAINNSDLWVIPYGDVIKISTIKDNGDIIKLQW